MKLNKSRYNPLCDHHQSAVFDISNSDTELDFNAVKPKTDYIYFTEHDKNSWKTAEEVIKLQANQQ